MEHLPVHDPESNRAPLVPRLEGFEYDRKGFSEFPARKGFDKSRLLAGDFSQYDVDRTSAFLQTWLYFGIMGEVFAEEFHQDDFISIHQSGRKYINSSKLPSYIEAWIVKARRSNSASMRSRAETCLDEANTVSMHLSGGLGGHTSCPLPPDICLSIMVLAASIEAALWHTGKSAGFEYQRKRWGYSRYLHDKMLQAGWCPNDLRRLHEHGSIFLVYYASTIPRNIPSHIIHQQCSNEECRAHDIDSYTYETKHCDDCSGCSHVVPNVNDAERILSNGDFPIMRIAPRSDSMQLEYVASSGSRFCAISHVWSDGLGNNAGNSLPLCQLRRLYGQAQKIFEGNKADNNKSHLIWIDTLCIPRGEPFRKLAISRIATCFAKAKYVLVLDSEMQQVSVKEALSGLLTRLACSGWMRRVWTLLEGSIAAPTLHVQLSDGVLALASAVEQQRNAWRKKTFVTDSLASDTGIFYENLTVMRLAYQKFSTNSADTHAFGFALHGFTGRSTSWGGDEYLCLGILMGLSEKAVGNLYDTPVAERSRYMFSVLHNVPHGLLFCPGPKISSPGLRWAPKDIWSARPYATYRPARLYGEDGIEVTYPGLILPSFPLVGNSFMFYDRATQTWYCAECDPEDGGSFPTEEVTTTTGHIAGTHDFGLILPTTKLANNGPRSFDHIPAVLISIYKTLNQTKHFLDIGRVGIYGRYICCVYLTLPSKEEVASHQAGQSEERTNQAKKAPVHVGESIRELFGLQGLSNMKSEWLDQTWYVS